MKKAVKAIIIILSSLIGAVLLLVAVSCVLYSPEYIFRCISNGESKITDYKFFPERTIGKSSTPYHYAEAPDSTYDTLNIQYTTKGALLEAPLDTLAKENDTTSLIVAHDDKVVYEKYFNGYDKDSINTSFSSVKSIDSLLIGMAIEDGFIKSETQPIGDFIPEFKGTEFENITIKQLLMMRSNILYRESGLWFGDDAKTYYMPDMRDLVLHHMSIDKSYKGQFLYNNYHPLLLGIILERSTGMSVADYFQKKIWDKVGAENDASWSLDSDKTKFEKMESGMNFKSIDYIKIGSMLLHNGKWNGNTLVNEDWIKRSTIAQELLPNSHIGYQYMWYSVDDGKGGKDFFANGKYGQLLYISPANNTVILRTGKSEGKIDVWVVVLMQLAQYSSSK